DTVPAPEPESALPETEAQPAKESAAPDAAQDQESQDLVLFLTPLTATIAKGEKVQLALMVSGGKGLANGTIDLGIDPKLKLTSATAGDYLTLEKGSLDPVGGGSGTVRLTFRRPNTHMDSGTLAMLEFEATASGSAPVMVQGGTYKVGANAIPAKVVNALVTVE
ncbi:MAG TPA: cohesin domain-containing protein, partial [Holophaga sp.]|nr:cohesin domain-containing protein [Holophaga sp.]